MNFLLKNLNSLKKPQIGIEIPIKTMTSPIIQSSPISRTLIKKSKNSLRISSQKYVMGRMRPKSNNLFIA